MNPISLLHKEAPLIHCITHPIVVNDCANAVLALGARPIMAEHPEEAASIAQIARSLTVSLGNITDAPVLRISGRRSSFTPPMA